jgi:catechol 2,3-dioxygenase-like lactoylglutathione lyase family enzyme
LVELALDRVLLNVPDQQRAIAAYERFLGRRAGLEPRVPNGAVQLGLPSWAPRPGLVFSAQDYDGAVRLLNRRGVPLVPVDDARRTAAAVVNGLLLGVVERSSAEQDAGDRAVVGEIGAIDHVVVATTHLDRIVATLGGRLGLDLRLEQRSLKVVQQLFFRCQNTVVEVLVKPGLPGKADELWGVAWRTGDIKAAHQRLARSGVPVSEIREGMKPGKCVVTVKDPALATPTLLIEQSER